MKKLPQMPPTMLTRPRRRGSGGGFSLVEMMIALLVFLVIALTAVSLVRTQIATFLSQQSQSQVNIGMRNALGQIEMDAAEAGSGFFPNINVPGSPIGITLTTGDNTGGTNAAYDTLTIISFDTSTLASPSSNSNGSAGCVNTSTATSLYLLPQASGTTAATLSANLRQADEVLLVRSYIDPNLGFPLIGSVTLSQASSSNGTTVQVTYTSSLQKPAGGLPQFTIPGNPPTTYTPTPYVDPADNFRITYDPSDKLSNDGTFCSTNSGNADDARAVKMTPIRYAVNPATLQLTRCQANANNPAPACYTNPADSSATVVAEHVLSFKVGVMLWQDCNSDIYAAGTCTLNGNTYNASATDAASYAYNSYGPSLCTDTANKCDFSLIRSIKVSMIVQTGNAILLNSNAVATEAASVVINPRNLSMHDQ
jgi:prepilin-type N-terminal cleavage/methylation domain-containing protein